MNRESDRFRVSRSCNRSNKSRTILEPPASELRTSGLVENSEIGAIALLRRRYR
ncbi:hypothetical protein H6F50_01505 [Coleofasciculus sp. FACHB-712]|uniref:hypothetical protein n=1 Tax=Coleofasciculus sp. FACHB-712 TaxID=2692789 RepID=UPI00168757FC|nr:hypothetical protein [Coleofasciculus sp. FACHB-712]MBD1941037.1 hypothetical protein [Coleofasciculus sp. FACHB-712]